MNILTAEKIRQVRKELRSGIPEGEIKNQLQSEGYSEEEISKAFEPHKYDMRSWYLCFGTLFFLAGIYTLLTNKGVLFLLFSAGMFYVYYLEKKRLNKSSS